MTDTTTKTLVSWSVHSLNDRLAEEHPAVALAYEEMKAARRKAESSPEAVAAGKAAMLDDKAPGRFTRGGDRRRSRAQESVGRKDPAYKQALAAYRKAVREAQK